MKKHNKDVHSNGIENIQEVKSSKKCNCSCEFFTSQSDRIKYATDKSDFGDILHKIDESRLNSQFVVEYLSHDRNFIEFVSRRMQENKVNSNANDSHANLIIYPSDNYQNISSEIKNIFQLAETPTPLLGKNLELSADITNGNGKPDSKTNLKIDFKDSVPIKNNTLFSPINK